ncbi:hypothetical protein TrispH2_012214, partial [Trichoplax sp. H2]
SSLVKNVWFKSSACVTAHFFAKVTISIAGTLTLVMAIDRFLLIVRPHSKWKFTMKVSQIITAVIWIVDFSCISGMAVYQFDSISRISSYTFDFNLNLCLGDFESTIVHRILSFLELGYYLVVYVVSLILYLLIIRKLRISRLTFGSQASSTCERRFQIMFTLIACTNAFAFFFITITSIGSDPNAERSIFQNIVSLFPFVNSAIDPILYLIFRRNDIKKQLCCWCTNDAVIEPASQSKTSQIDQVSLMEIQN